MKRPHHPLPIEVKITKRRGTGAVSTNVRTWVCFREMFEVQKVNTMPLYSLGSHFIFLHVALMEKCLL